MFCARAQAPPEHAPPGARLVEPRDCRRVYRRERAHPTIRLRHETPPEPAPRVLARVHSRGGVQRYFHSRRGEYLAIYPVRPDYAEKLTKSDVCVISTDG